MQNNVERRKLIYKPLICLFNIKSFQDAGFLCWFDLVVASVALLDIPFVYKQ